MLDMKESEIETYFVWTVERMGGKAYKFASPSQRGVADRIACLPNGQTWFVELKTKGGRLSPLQKMFAAEVLGLKQKHTVLWSKEAIDQWRLTTTK
jgi:hypothetical protein